MRRGWFVLVAGILFACSPPLSAAADIPVGAPSPAPSPTSRAEYIAAQLRKDPVYVTDHAPRALPADAAARIKASVARLGVPVFVAVTLTSGLAGDEPGDSFVSLLHDRLGEEGVYIAVGPSGTGGEARQFGGGRALPVDDAWTAAEFETASDAGADAVVERFVEIALSGHARERRDHPSPRPKSKTRLALDADDRADRRADRIEKGAFAAGAAAGGLPLLALLVFRRVRKGHPPAKPQNRTPARKGKPAPKKTKKPRTVKQ
ncbi:hypothetical protein [Actinomadura fibrosa]|uniref:TPM domain-containing protein n=1 Tax=Actinomadura fibrosa TaxID=111802 RepID=A0ABW2XXT0_9ACTN|nr:hypothetical protein [Actinomadura fibrosa]